MVNGTGRGGAALLSKGNSKIKGKMFKIVKGSDRRERLNFKPRDKRLLDFPIAHGPNTAFHIKGVKYVSSSNW